MRTILATGCRTRRQAAFTLIEVSIVVFIIGILIAASTPYLVHTYNSAVLNDVVRGFGTTCQYARIKAVTQQRTVTMHVDLKRQVFWLTQQPAAPTEDDGSTDPSTLKVYEIPKRVAMISAELTEQSLSSTSDKPSTDTPLEQGIVFTFYPNGTCDGAKVVFRGAEPKDVLSVVVDPVTARTTAFPVVLK
jgi:prepilin-type N-terminal cleavage/methylation domain-containing protein